METCVYWLKTVFEGENYFWIPLFIHGNKQTYLITNEDNKTPINIYR